MLAQENRFDEAVGHFAEARSIKPDDVGARNNLGRAFVEPGRLNERRFTLSRIMARRYKTWQSLLQKQRNQNRALDSVLSLHKL